MAQFFIDRPIFAWVIALFILVLGGVAITQLPIAQYPPVAPPVDRPHRGLPGRLGADAGRRRDQRHRAGDERLAGHDLHGVGQPGQRHRHRSRSASSRAPTPTWRRSTCRTACPARRRACRAAVTQQGVRVDKSRSNFLLFTILSSDNPAYDPIALGDYASRNVLPEIQRMPGVGQAQLFGTERAMRDLDRPGQAGRLQPVDQRRHAAIAAQNAQVSSGTHRRHAERAGAGDLATVVVKGQLDHGRAVRRHRAARQPRRLDRAAARRRAHRARRPDLRTSARLNGQPSTGIGVQLSPTGNALATAEAIRRGWRSSRGTSRKA